jgi:hypothetical protein
VLHGPAAQALELLTSDVDRFARMVATGCGVSAQDEPQPLVTSPVVPSQMPTLTQRPDPPSTSSSAPEPTATSTGAARSTMDE